MKKKLYKQGDILLNEDFKENVFLVFDSEIPELKNSYSLVYMELLQKELICIDLRKELVENNFFKIGEL